MKKYFHLAKSLAYTKTAKDTYIIFAGNILSAFLGFVYFLLIARVVSVSDFGIFSAATNLIYIVVSITDLGISGGIIRFVAKLRSEGKDQEADAFVKSAFVIKTSITILIASVFLIFPGYFAEKLMATSQKSISIWVFVSIVGFIFYSFFPYILQAQKKFFKAVIVENSYGIVRFLAIVVFFYFGVINLSTLLFTFSFSNIAPLVFGLLYVGTGFLFTKPNWKVYKSLILFSGWLGFSRIITSVSGRLDVQMLANLSGAIETGIYSIPSRLSIFIIILTGSFGTVLAPRFSSFADKEKERNYIVKASLFLIPIIAGIILWIAIAEPFIVYLFGEKYIDSVPVFRILALSTIPFLTTAPSASAIIYAMKKPVYIGIFAPFQLLAIYLLNRSLIPVYGSFGPAITLLIVNTLIALYVWFIVIKYYWFSKRNS